MGRVRKGRKSSIFFFEILGNRVMLNSVQNHSSVAATFDNHGAQHSQNLVYICPLLTASNSKNFKKQQKPEGCDSLLPVGNLCFSFFLAKIIHLQLSSKENFEVRSFKNLWMLWILCLQFLSDHISSTHGKSQGKSVWGPLFIHLLASFSRVDDIQQVFTCQRFAIFFGCFKKALWILAFLHRPSTE